MKIVILGNPIPKARARHASRVRRARGRHRIKSRRVVTYDPQDREKQAVKRQMATEATEMLSGCAFEVEMNFFLPVPPSATPGARNGFLWGLSYHTVKPDFDNLAKFYCDCANGVLWPDDAMVVTGKITKHYSNNPRTEITVTEKKQLNLNAKATGIMKVFSPDELYDFLKDVHNLSLISPGDIYEIAAYPADKTKDWMTAMAYSLDVFAEKHASKLTKIRKFAGLHEEIDKDNKLNELNEKYA
jgi:Holliday junction resolvase RusA-like endonuclease